MDKPEHRCNRPPVTGTVEIARFQVGGIYIFDDIKSPVPKQSIQLTTVESQAEVLAVGENLPVHITPLHPAAGAVDDRRGQVIENHGMLRTGSDEPEQSGQRLGGNIGDQPF